MPILKGGETQVVWASKGVKGSRFTGRWHLLHGRVAGKGIAVYVGTGPSKVAVTRQNLDKGCREVLGWKDTSHQVGKLKGRHEGGVRRGKHRETSCRTFVSDC